MSQKSNKKKTQGDPHSITTNRAPCEALVVLKVKLDSNPSPYLHSLSQLVCVTIWNYAVQITCYSRVQFLLPEVQ